MIPKGQAHYVVKLTLSICELNIMYLNQNIIHCIHMKKIISTWLEIYADRPSNHRKW